MRALRVVLVTVAVLARLPGWATAAPMDRAFHAATPVSFAWSKQAIRSGGYLTCPTAAFCMLGGRVAGDPFSGGFRKVRAPGDWVSCASATLCLGQRSSHPDFVNE